MSSSPTPNLSDDEKAALHRIITSHSANSDLLRDLAQAGFIDLTSDHDPYHRPAA